MVMTAKILTGLVGLLHLYFLYLEMFQWDKPKGLKVFGNTLEKAKASKVLAANQGLYNGFLSAGLLYGLFIGGRTGYEFRIFFLICVIVAGAYGAVTVSRKIFFIQASPAIVALLMTYFYKDSALSQLQNIFN